MSTRSPSHGARRPAPPVYLTLLGLLAVLVSAGVQATERWVGASVGADFVNFDPMPTASIEAGLWPDHKKIGYQAYLEFADPACDDEMWTIGAEAILRLRTFYGGVGLALSDERLCERAGTKWNFSIAVGMRLTQRLDIQWRHRSHGEDFGIREGTPNDGVNLIELRWRLRNR